MFYGAVVGQEDKVMGLFQPKKAQTLPKVLVEEEVSRRAKLIEVIFVVTG